MLLRPFVVDDDVAAVSVVCCLVCTEKHLTLYIVQPFVAFVYFTEVATTALLHFHCSHTIIQRFFHGSVIFYFNLSIVSNLVICFYKLYCLLVLATTHAFLADDDTLKHQDMRENQTIKEASKKTDKNIELKQSTPARGFLPRGVLSDFFLRPLCGRYIHVNLTQITGFQLRNTCIDFPAGKFVVYFLLQGLL